MSGHGDDHSHSQSAGASSLKGWDYVMAVVQQEPKVYKKQRIELIFPKPSKMELIPPHYRIIVIYLPVAGAAYLCQEGEGQHGH